MLSKVISNKQRYKLIRFINIHHIRSIVCKSFLFVWLSESYRERRNFSECKEDHSTVEGEGIDSVMNKKSQADSSKKTSKLYFSD